MQVGLRNDAPASGRWSVTSIEKPCPGHDPRGGGRASSAGKLLEMRDMEMKEQSFEPFRLYVEAYGLDECDPDPAFLEVTVSPEFIGTLLRLHSLCATHGLVSVNAEDQWSTWDQENDLNLRGQTLRVYRDGDFWFEAHKKHGGNVESRAIDIKTLMEIARKGPGQSDDYRFAWRDGALFFSISSPDDLIQLVDDATQATGVREVVDED